ncbi:hypothetical protein GHT06_005711 [Daphnia sinensis]|uniref:Uncharacterized protein n=1 Tax=Daphnia sinensis TaxID=1820382 RepID=A0AAD5KSY5_9CRUS|nr:hypothetical protein GHT06_005711 [Daphnia sinensis]
MSHGRSVVTAAGERSRRRSAEEAAKEIQTYYSGLRAATPLARSTAVLQGANEALVWTKGRSRGPPGGVSELTLGQKGTCVLSEDSLPREVPDQAQFQSDSEPQGEEFEDAQGYQDSGNPEAGSGASEGAVGPIAARRQYEEAREVGNKGGVNARTRAEAEERQVGRVIDRDQGSRSRQAEFDDRESPIPQVTVSSVQEGTGVKAVSAEAETVEGDQVSQSQRKKLGDPNSSGTKGLLTGSQDVRRSSARAEDVTGGRSAVGVEADTTGVINRSSGTHSSQPVEARGLGGRIPREGLRPRAFSTPQEATPVRQGRSGFSVGGSPSRQSLEEPELDWDPFLGERKTWRNVQCSTTRSPKSSGARRKRMRLSG